MDSALDWHNAKALLEWQYDLGADCALAEAPVDRFAAEEIARAKAAERAAAPMPGKRTQPVPLEKGPDPVEVAVKLAKETQDLASLREAMAQYSHCDLKKGARNLVFSDGVAGSKVMIIGEAPGRDEDRVGKPFVGRAGQLLDKMLAAIDLSRESNVYITNVLPWRPPQNRDPLPEEIAMMQPFLKRHIALADPDILIVMGNISCDALLGRRGITRLRGGWTEAEGRPAIPMFHPAYLLRQPHLKREAWADLLSLRAKLEAVS